MKLHVVLTGFLLGTGALGLAACGDDGGGRVLADAPTSTQLVVTPADLTVTVTNGVAVMQAYSVHAIDPSGNDTDVTATATLAMQESAYGTFVGPTATITGAGAGPTRVIASLGSATGDTGLTVLVHSSIIDPTAPAGADGLFDAATEDPSIAPLIVYPSDHILVPPNLGQFDTHWNNNPANTDNLFEVKLANQYVDIRLYTSGINAAEPNPFWTVFAPEVWAPIASSRQTLSLTVAGLNTAQPATKGMAASQSVDVTNENAQGGIYYWSTTAPQGIWRYDIAKPSVPPAPFFTTAPTSCMGCHSLSRDGTKIALTIDSATGRGTVWDVATQAPFYDINEANIPYFDFAAFNGAANKLVTVEGGNMHLRNLDSSLIFPEVIPPLTAGYYGTQPEFSPDNTKLVNVEYQSGADYYMNDGSIVVRSWDDTTNTFGAPTMLVAGDTATGQFNYYPSFSPDGKWVVFTRANGYSYNNPTAETWVVKADGTAPPILLNTANITGQITNSWARWVPFGQTYGASGTQLFYLTFSTQRPFGVRIPSGGRPQIWMTPFFPDKAQAGQDPSGNSFRVPFQRVDTSNHIAQWTQAVVVQ